MPKERGFVLTRTNAYVPIFVEIILISVNGEKCAKSILLQKSANALKIVLCSSKDDSLAVYLFSFGHNKYRSMKSYSYWKSPYLYFIK